MSRFAYVKYDDDIAEAQAVFKKSFRGHGKRHRNGIAERPRAVACNH